MPDTEFIGLILLLVVAVVFGYFYLKRAQRRDHAPTTPGEDRGTTAPSAQADEAAANATDAPDSRDVS